MEMYEMPEDTTSQQLTLFQAASPAKTYRLPESVRAWLESEADFGLSSIEFSKSLSQDGSSLKTSLACYPATEDGTLPSSFKGWRNSGMASLGGYLTLSTPEYHSDAVVCSLSEVLETDVPRKYYLSPRACRGILRRAEKRGRELPPPLKQALQAVAMQEATP